MSSAEPNQASPLGPVEMVVLQGTSFCNLNCAYCYLSQESRRNKATMPLSTILATFEKLFSSPYLENKVRVSWHSGEPLVLRPDYYRAAMDGILNLRTSLGVKSLDVQFDIQTNGTLINQEWCDLLHEYQHCLSIGVSCDGPDFLHDKHRRTWSDKPTHSKTEHGLQLLSSNAIPFDITAVISPEGLDHPIEFIEYFAPYLEHIREFHFNLHDEFFIEEDLESKIEKYIKRYQLFLRALLDYGTKSHCHPMPRIRNFSSFYHRLFTNEEEHSGYDARSMSKPFKTLSIEANGDVTTFYAGLTLDECRDLKNLYGDNHGLVIGNILTDTLSDIAHSNKLKRIMADFEASHSACERGCEYFNLCSGGYNLIKHRRFGRFDATETPECRVHVKTFADTLLNHLDEHLSQ
ncbi:hypothetical protein C7H85_09430 [Zobellella endophytica]|uniref:Radical SAM core domain-containing protein n=1 Tax=Zobellella endophytica TaxID=2116700 RepID=A0A2P7R5V5_9GAMM|nr:radical SAM protein [Zobellella endophytica]PSJ45598.1 hypothetical protein C7H85_09430 [Zobellella endophytica]